MPPTAAIVMHPSQNNTFDTLKLQVHASVELWIILGYIMNQKTRAVVQPCELVKGSKPYYKYWKQFWKKSMSQDKPNNTDTAHEYDLVRYWTKVTISSA